MCQNVPQKVLSKGPNLKQKLQVILKFPSMDEGPTEIGHSMTVAVILRINNGWDFISGSLWYFIIKCDSYFITKWDKYLLQSASGFLLQNASILLHNETVFTNCDVYYKMRRYNRPYQRTVRKLWVNVIIYYFLSMMKVC